MNESQIKKLDEAIKHPEFLDIKWFSKGINLDEELEGFNPVREGFSLYLDIDAPEGLSISKLDLNCSAFGHTGNLIRVLSFYEGVYEASWIDIKIKKGHPMYRPGIFD